MLNIAEPDQAIAVAVDHGRRRDHFGIEPYTLGNQAQKVPVVPVRPLHHRCDAEAIWREFGSHVGGLHARTVRGETAATMCGL